MDRKVIRPRKVAWRRSYVEPQYDTDYESLPEGVPKPSRQSARLRAAYDDLSNTDTHSPSENELPPPQKHHRRARPTKRKTRSDTAKRKEFGLPQFKRTKPSHENTKMKHIKKAPVQKSKPQPLSRARIPPWQALPYQVLLKIVKYAAYPLYKEGSNDTGSTAWLLKVSLLSHSIHDACLGTLLYSPPLYPSYRAHGLIKLLETSRDQFGEDIGRPIRNKSLEISTDYRPKIKCLSIDTKNLLATKSGIQLADLVQHTPLLKNLEFYHNHDFISDRAIWAHPNASVAKNKWQYTQLYSTLASLPFVLHLRHFEWTARFLTKDDGILMRFVEFNKTTEYFKDLESMTLRNFILDDVEKLNETVAGTSLKNGLDISANVHQARLMTWRIGLKEAFIRSPQLKQLSIHSSNVFDTASFAILPHGLEKLEIVNCPFVNSEGLQWYLSRRGGKLQELILKGNQYMSIDFMTDLRRDTPKLACLNVDFTYRDPTSFQDTEPLFDSLLPSGPPTWPTDLQEIVIGPLRQLSSQDAEKFYQSLVEVADQMKYLRVLEIRTLLNEAGWRDRAALRTKWSTIFHEVFDISMNPGVQPPAPTSSSHPGKKRSLESRNQQEDDRRVTKKPRRDCAPKRVSQRIQDLALSDSQSQMSDFQVEPLSPRQSSMLAAFNGTRDDDDHDNDENQQAQSFSRQGRCHTVVFELSDQRPAQEQFNEADFLDDEADLEEDADFRG